MKTDKLLAVVVVIVCGLNTFTNAGAETVLSSDAVTRTEVAPEHQLNINIGLFDAGIPSDGSTHRQLRVFPEVRAVEARFLPFVLRQILIESDEWGAVRVVPTAGPGDELYVKGLILKSDGETLEVRLSATDAFGREWVDGTYSMESGLSIADSKDPNNQVEISTSFQNLFKLFSNDLRVARSTYDSRTLRQNREVALLRYAGNLLPDVYADYLGEPINGIVEIARLPAKNDPMLGRIQRIREFEYRFIDAIDEQYESLYSRIEQTYNLWLRYQERLTRYRLDGEKERRSSASSGNRGSFNAMKESYERYKWLKTEEQNLRSWARGFSNEVAPTVVEIEGRVVKLEGSLEQRYEEWGGILRAILQQETGGIK